MGVGRRPGGVAVITGAGAGIGAGLARHAVTLGMTTVLADVDAEAVAALRDELRAAGGAAMDVVCDVRDPLAVQDLAERTYRDVGPVRLLVNNAGVEQFGYLWDTPIANWRASSTSTSAESSTVCGRSCRR